MLKIATAAAGILITGFAATLAPDPGHRSTAYASNDRIEDVWALRIRVEESGVGSGIPHPGEYSASVALLRIPAQRAQPWMTVSGFSYAGVFTDNFQALGVTPSDRERIPVAGARTFGRDSVEVVLNATQNHGAMILKGVFNGARVTGRWQVTGYVPGANGTFEMAPLH